MRRSWTTCRPVRGGAGNVKRIRRRRPLDLHPVQAIEHLDPALDLARLRGLVAEALDEALDLRHALGLVAGAGLDQRLAGLALGEVVVVVARIELEAGGGQLGHRRDHAVQEVAVVGDDDHRAVVRVQVALEPAEGLEIEVVRRLVEEEERRALEQEPRERRPHPPAPRELAERAREVRLPEAEPAQDDPRLRLEPVAAERLEAMLEVAVPRGQRLVRRRVEAGGQVLELPLDLPDFREAGQHLAEDRAARLPGGLLGEVADRRLARPADASGVGRLDSRQDPAERGLADAVRPDQADALAPAELPRDLAEQHAIPVGLGRSLELDHPNILRTRSNSALPPGGPHPTRRFPTHAARVPHGTEAAKWPTSWRSGRWQCACPTSRRRARQAGGADPLLEPHRAIAVPCSVPRGTTP